MWIDVRSALGRVARVQQGFDGGQTRTHVVGAIGAGELDRLQQQVQVFSRVVVECVEVIIGEDAQRLDRVRAAERTAAGQESAVRRQRDPPHLASAW